MHRTQFDDRLLTKDRPHAELVWRNNGRQVVVLPDGTVVTGLSWGGERPVVRIWQELTLLTEHALPGLPSAPCLLLDGQGKVQLWLSAGNVVMHSSDVTKQPQPVGDLRGQLEDALVCRDGSTLLAITHETKLSLVAVSKSGQVSATTSIDAGASHASMELDDQGELHLVYGKADGLEYRRLHAGTSVGTWKIVRELRVAEAYSWYGVVMPVGKQVLISYVGESGRLHHAHCVPQEGGTWNRRLGLGGFIAMIVLEGDQCTRLTIKDSKQIVNSLRAKMEGFADHFHKVTQRVRMEEFGAPSICLDQDGIVQVYWADVERRWIFSSRRLGQKFSPAVEVDGPFEQLQAPCLLPKRVTGKTRQLPLVVTTTTRTYMDTLALPASVVTGERRIDFLQCDDLVDCQGFEQAVATMTRHEENPIIARGEPGSFDDGAIVADIFIRNEKWEAEYIYQTTTTQGMRWVEGGLAVSDDGFRWKKLKPIPISEQLTIDDAKDKIYAFVRYCEDPEETNPAQRYKGLARIPAGWLAWGAVVSADAKNWYSVKDRSPDRIVADNDLQVWRDPYDVPSRRFKAMGIGQSFCGRVCVQWTSPDGMHWNDIRDTLDFYDPFGSPPMYAITFELGGTGRILVDPWAGPDDEDEVHGGYVFHEGDRWLCLYMKWSADGHIFCSLASSRDGIHYTRVCNGEAVLPLGEPGTWDSGRVATRTPPILVGDMWRQYYTGCGWKHGLNTNGETAATSPVCRSNPNQVGVAQIPAGRWGFVQLTRDANEGSLTTIPLHLEKPHELTADAVIDVNAGSLRCAILDARTGKPLPGFDFADCDPVTGDSKASPITWQGKSLDRVPGNDIRISVSMAGRQSKLYGLNLR